MQRNYNLFFIVDSSANYILSQIDKGFEVSLSDALALAPKKYNDHRDQYPLALLIEEGYVGITLTHEAPEGTEMMREFSQAISLHMFTLEKNKEGIVEYLDTSSIGNVDPGKEKVFIKAKGALYLEDCRQRKRERNISFMTGLGAGLIITVVSHFIGYFIRTNL